MDECMAKLLEKKYLVIRILEKLGLRLMIKWPIIHDWKLMSIPFLKL